MSLFILIPLLVAVIGIVIAFVSANPKAVIIGYICFFCGLLVTLMSSHFATFTTLR